MRIFRGLENIHSVIDRHEAEWRREQGEAVDLPDELSIEEAVRRRLTATSTIGTGKFSANRFLGTEKKKPEPSTAPEVHEEPEGSNNVEVVSVIKQKDDKRHSWLYNEVLKAVNDAIGNDSNAKVIAVFIPVIQNGKEFEDLPADEVVTLSPVNEEPVNVEELLDVSSEPEPEASAEIEPEEPEMLDEVLGDTSEVQELSEPELPEPEAEPEQSLELPEPESEPELPPMSEEFDLIPEGQVESDPELADAFREMEEKLDENLQAEADTEPEIMIEPEEPESEILPSIPEEISSEPEETITIEHDEPDGEEAEEAIEIPAGEPMKFEEISLPEELDDDEVYDDVEFNDDDIRLLPDVQDDGEKKDALTQE